MWTRQLFSRASQLLACRGPIAPAFRISKPARTFRTAASLSVIEISQGWSRAFALRPRSPLATACKPVLRKVTRVTRDAAYRAFSNRARNGRQPSIEPEDPSAEESTADILARLNLLVDWAFRELNSIKADLFGRRRKESIHFHEGMLRLIKLLSELRLIEKAYVRLKDPLLERKIEDFHDPKRKRKNFLDPRSRYASNREVAVLEKMVRDSHIDGDVETLRLGTKLLRQQAFQQCSALMSNRGSNDIRLDLATEVLVDGTGQNWNRQKAQELSMMLEEWL